MDALGRPGDLARRDMPAQPETAPDCDCDFGAAEGGAPRVLARGRGVAETHARAVSASAPMSQPPAAPPAGPWADPSRPVPRPFRHAARTPQGAAASPLGALGPRGKAAYRHGQDHAGAKRLLIGWREWALFPDLGLPPIRGKIDTGARSSALHALHIQEVRLENGQRGVQFLVHPRQRLRTPEFQCRAPIHDRREVRSSNGQVETRYVLRTRLVMGPLERVIELTLTNRSAMGYRLLIGRQALRGAVLIDPAASHLLGLPNVEVG